MNTLSLILFIIGILFISEGLIVFIFSKSLKNFFLTLSKDEKLVKRIGLLEIIIAIVVIILSFILK
ncbi:MAG: hypothetical protein ACOC3Z_02350 [Nanoarchaeota archaeon]